MSDIERNKNIIIILASQPTGKMKHKDLFRALGIDEEAFNQAIKFLLNEYSIEKIKIEEYNEFYEGYGVTKFGIEHYDLQEKRESLVDDPQYIPLPDSPYEPADRQDTKMIKALSKAKKQRRRVFLFFGCIFVIIIGVGLFFLFYFGWLF